MVHQEKPLVHCKNLPVHCETPLTCRQNLLICWLYLAGTSDIPSEFYDITGKFHSILTS